MRKISIIIPAYNEEKRIGKTLQEYSRFFMELKRRKRFDYEALVVINNTTDKTEDIVREFAKKNTRIKYINLKPGGKGFAVMEGFKKALKENFDLIGFVDADMSTSPGEYYKLIKNVEGYDGIIASRGLTESKAKMSPYRKITHMSFNFITKMLLHLRYKDTQCGAKIFTRETIENLLKNEIMTQWAFDVDLLYKLKEKKIAEIPTVWKDKKGSKVNLRAPIKMFASIVRLRLIYSPFKFVVKAYDKLPERIKAHNL